MSFATTTATTLANDVVTEDETSVLTHRIPAQTTSSVVGPPISSLSIPDELTGKAPYESIPLLRRAFYTLRIFYVLFVMEFPLLWSWLKGARNERADLEGPFYIAGAPDRQIAEGRAIIASREDMEVNPPYVLTVRILTPSGDPLPYAKFDFWQATTTGWYYNSKYRLRGTFQADAEGKCQILTVIAGAYGLSSAKESEDLKLFRAGHFHIMVYPPDGEDGKDLENLTTQVYVCRKNDPKDMRSDFLNYLRAARTQNMVHSWATSAFYPSLSSPTYSAFATKYSFPPVPPTGIDTLKSIDWWNAVLAERFPGQQQLKVMAAGETTLKLNKKPWLSFPGF
ncbi:Intradiol ring-cleavage dioxygenase [Cristinia sonorae]|uniref:Intradiol ring-cleavage dioxygenase n=1 Tax=Cristinia sonorae TaxID=1940300 RepID=A0A8K0XLU7_9AGAR|nr:Intradiol ring-cleavage dioxygenase [Cristinia sonorae]